MKGNKIQIKTILIFISFGLALLMPLILSDFRISQLGRFYSFAILALSLNFLWGYVGILSLGHGLYFTLGAYSIALYLKLQSGLPDFMEWNGITELPFVYQLLQSFPFALLCVILLPALFAAVIGFFTFRSKISGVYFTILTQAITLAFSILLVSQQSFTGGSNGITNFKGFFGVSVVKEEMIFSMYYVNLLLLILIMAGIGVILKTKTGKILISIRSKEDRLSYLGYNTYHYKLMAYIFSAVLAGIAGALYAPQIGLVSPSLAGISISIEAAVWVVVGGIGSFFGPLIGAIAINYLKILFNENFPEIWLYFIGGIIIVILLFAPKGLVHLVKTYYKKVRKAHGS